MSEGLVMSIDELEKAAKAAGYAMATDEDAAVASPSSTAVVVYGRASAPAAQAPRAVSQSVTGISWDLVSGATGWVRGHLPFGGRATA